MPKVKVPRKSTAIDMTAMCDVSFLLLTFFMLTSNFTAKEPVIVSTPSSISEIKIPETNIMQIIVDPKGKIFFGIDGQQHRTDLLNKMGELYSIKFTPEEQKQYSLINSSGVPMSVMKNYLNLPVDKRDLPENQLGIPIDTTITQSNEFRAWVKFAREVNPKITIAIKADKGTSYKVIKNVMGTMQKLNENRYNLITSLETATEKKEEAKKK
jgi:biopolymer transport protein ExbD